MSYFLHTVEVNGQTLTRTTNGYKYEYAVLVAGRKIEAIRAGLQRTIDAADPEFVSSRLEGFLAGNEHAQAWTPQRRAEFLEDQIEGELARRIPEAKRAQKQLKALESVPAGTFVWEKASWHADFELAKKAARGYREHIIRATVTVK